MSKLDKKAFLQLIEEDISELKKYMPEHSIIKDHIIACLNDSAKHNYPEEKEAHICFHGNGADGKPNKITLRYYNSLLCSCHRQGNSIDLKIALNEENKLKELVEKMNQAFCQQTFSKEDLKNAFKVFHYTSFPHNHPTFDEWVEEYTKDNNFAPPKPPQDRVFVERENPPKPQ